MSVNTLNTEWKLPKIGSKLDVEFSDFVSDAYGLTHLVQKAREAHRLVVVICEKASDALRFYEEIRWLDPSISVRFFPDWETLPYDTMSPHEDIVSERIETLWQLSNRSNTIESIDVLLVSAQTAPFFLPPPNYVLGNSIFYKKNDIISIETARRNLTLIGYSLVNQVMAPGEFSVRGEILDIYPMGTDAPFRIDLFDNSIESIKTFDPQTQRSTEEIERIRILPGHEFPMDDESLQKFRTRWKERFSGDPLKCPLYADTLNSIAGAGLEYYISLFFDDKATLFSYLPENTIIVTHGMLQNIVEKTFKETEERYQFLQYDSTRPVLPANEILSTKEDFFGSINRYAHIRYRPNTHLDFGVEIERKQKHPTDKLVQAIKKNQSQNIRTLICTSGEGRLERIQEILDVHVGQLTRVASFQEFLASESSLCVATSPLTEGFSHESVTVITETELYKLKPQARRTRLKQSQTSIDCMIRDLSELKIGDPVVHAEHGIGRYRGLIRFVNNDIESEFVQIDYANNAKLYVPVNQLHLISRYSGADSEHAPLYGLGRGQWEKMREKAEKKAHDTAAELLHIYALRESRKATRYKINASDYESFCEGFEFEETPDQTQAIQSVIADMQSDKPMDRLVCGDVGFGKTEVALRAAFIAAMNGKQVAVLCPTTLLAEQHMQTFKERFANWPIRIEELSRFRTGKETTRIVKELAEGTIDIVIGTHKLLSKSVRFKRLGLIVIDEEHRFGVRQKELFKSLRAEVDVLTLTATPIPRTLSMSLEGIRDFSVIATAPQKRLAIKTFVREESNELIREALIREIKRGGQAYFLHNEVETIRNTYERLTELVPEARIAIAHGQMSEYELEHVMRDFYRQKTNVLLCSTIIETGIDIPNANTIIMRRADKFGLAQLHQLRGRVGRSHHQAYAYLLIPSEESITKNAQKRLQAIQDLEELGSGFYLSMHDMEIRGAGEILGESQSGEIAEVGFELYNKMLSEAIKNIKNGNDTTQKAPFDSPIDINLHLPSLIPQNYVPDVSTRLNLYKELSSCETNEDLERAIDMLTDRFGKMPEQTRALIAMHKLRMQSQRIGLERIDANEKFILLHFNATPPFDIRVFIRLLQSRHDIKMVGPLKLKIMTETKSLDDRIRAIRSITNPLQESVERARNHSKPVALIKSPKVK